MRAKLAGLNHCAVSVLSCAAANLCWYYYIMTAIYRAVQVRFRDVFDMVKVRTDCKIFHIQ